MLRLRALGAFTRLWKRGLHVQSFKFADLTPNNLDQALIALQKEGSPLNLSLHVQEQILCLCLSKAHEFPYAVKYIELRTLFRKKAPRQLLRFSEDPTEAHNRLLAECNLRLIEKIQQNPKEIELLSKYFNIRPVVPPPALLNVLRAKVQEIKKHDKQREQKIQKFRQMKEMKEMKETKVETVTPPPVEKQEIIPWVLRKLDLLIQCDQSKRI